QNLPDVMVSVQFILAIGERILNKRTAITKMFNLLTDYGKSLGKTHGANIVAKLDLEKRLSVVPMDYLL
ncbi:hypothetical protein EBB69_08185, partial [Lactobacillus delbrueckii]|nr:hypothetical protein [Lactobacillus delbrueckii]